MTGEETPGAKRATRNVGPLTEGVLQLRVSYRDTDQMGFVYYANFLVYFEMARTDLLRSMGRTYRECEEAGIFLPVLEATCQYQTPGVSSLWALNRAQRSPDSAVVASDGKLAS